MSLNCQEIQLITENIAQHGIIRKYSQPDDKTLVISYQTDSNHIFDLTVCVADKFNFICANVASSLLHNENLKFSQYLNSRQAFGRIIGIKQYKLSRLVDITIGGQEKTSHLLCRLWGSGGNIMLTDDNFVIEECLHRYPKRGEWPGQQLFLDDLLSKNTNYQIRNIFKTSDINKTVYQYYTRQIEHSKIDKIKTKIETLAKNQLDILQNKLSNLETSTVDPEQYLQIGELLKSSAYKLQDYASQAELFDYSQNAPIVIKLKPTLTIKQNMQDYFNKYKKAKQSLIFLEEQKQNLKLKISQIKKVADSANAETSPELLVKHLENINLLCGKKTAFSNKPTFGRLFILAGGTKAFVSKNAKDADKLLKTVAKGNDYWFHIRDYAGSHVIVKSEKGKPLDPTAKIQAAHLALYYSQLRTDSNLSAISDGDVYFTQIKYLHKPNTNTPGLVLPTQEKNIKVNFKKSIIDEIFN